MRALLAVIIGSNIIVYGEAFVCSTPTDISRTRRREWRHRKFASRLSSPMPHTASSLTIVPKSSLCAQNVETSDHAYVSSFHQVGPSVFFLALAASLGKLVADMMNQSSSRTSIGSLSLFLVSISVCYDNLIVGLGGLLFRNSHKTLKRISHPRFFLHFLGVPMLYTSTAEIGKAAGVKWLSSSLIQYTFVVVAVIIFILSSIRFFASPGIVLADTSDYPSRAIARQLVWFTYAKQDFIYYVFPSILLAFWNLTLGMAVHQHEAAGGWLSASAVSVLVGSAPRKHIARFTGNLAECIMLWCMFQSSCCVT